MKITWLYFITSILFFGLAYSKEVRTVRREELGDEVFFYSAPNKTEILQIQPRVGGSIRLPRQQTKANPAARNLFEPTMTSNVEALYKRAENSAAKVPILIYRGPHRPRELYHFREKTKTGSQENLSYISASSKQVDINQGNMRNNRNSVQAIPMDKKPRNVPASTLYEDISILQEPHVESTIDRPSSSEYFVPEKQNYAIYPGGKYADEDADIDSLSANDNSGNFPSSLVYKTTFQAAQRSGYDFVKGNYAPSERSKNGPMNGNARSGPKGRNSNFNRPRIVYSRYDNLKNFTPPRQTNPHPAYVNNQFEARDHYDAGFSLPKYKRENQAMHRGFNNFGIEFDYENYDTYVRPIPRYHRASKSQPEFDGDLNFDGKSSLEEPARPIQNNKNNNNNRTTRRNNNGRQRSRKASKSATTINPDVSQTQTEYEGQSYQTEADFLRNANYEDHQSPSRGSGRKASSEKHDTYATTTAIEDTYANVEIRRTQPRTRSRTTSKSPSPLRSSGGKRSRTTSSGSSRTTRYPRYFR